MVLLIDHHVVKDPCESWHGSAGPGLQVKTFARMARLMTRYCSDLCQNGLS
eukprot:CAMPEP_0115361858 /NCGR_PEP_ID=MMETSP0270-20121206/102414_1 /TAXON_ID=71861 /ORGANISM="Scrippsiella trochoidea, Strain CCMP3099" /LENGTH=50 /DNA_ID=CAMNT_0002784427 /DNA_START=736 /DNA_END=885 /DNA_ORIENTATION=+